MRAVLIAALLSTVLAGCVSREPTPSPRTTTASATASTRQVPPNPAKGVASETAGAFADFGSDCVEWLVSDDDTNPMEKINCENLWEWLPTTWTELEAAVAE